MNDPDNFKTEPTENDETALALVPEETDGRRLRKFIADCRKKTGHESDDMIDLNENQLKSIQGRDYTI